MIWDCTDGCLSDSANWTEDNGGHRNHAYRRPISAAICVELSLLAVVYRGQDIFVWDIENNALYDTYGKETGAQRNGTATTSAKNFVTGGLVFSSDPGVTLLAASYSDGDLVLFDITEGIVKEKTLANAQLLASSPNGPTLAAADSAGRIQVYDFETLKLLHCISAADFGIRSLAFSHCNTHLLDIRGSECRVWDPTALLRPDEVDENSDTVSVFTQPQETILVASEDIALITTLACHGNGELLYCGKSDGGVYLYETNLGLEVQKIISHASTVSITLLILDSQSGILSSVDSSSRVMCHKLTIQKNKVRGAESLFDHRVGAAVDQVLLNKGATRLLVSSIIKDMLYSIVNDGSSMFTSTEMVEPRPHRWANHPINPDQIVLMSNEGIHLYEWKTLQRLITPDSILLKGKILSQLSVRSLAQCAQSHYLAATFSESLASHARSKKLLLWSPSDLSLQSISTRSPSSYRILADEVQALIGAHGQKLLFLHSNGWVCSTDLEISSIEGHTRHFFIPTDWLSAGANLMIDVTCNGDIVFVKRHEPAIVKSGLETSEQGPNAASRSPRSPIRAQRSSLAKSTSTGSDSVLLRPYSERKRPSLPVGTRKASDDIF